MVQLKLMSRAGAFALAAMLPITVGADALNPVLDDKWTFKLGVLHNKADADITVSVAPLPPTPVSLDFLGIEDEQTSPWLSFRWRFSQKWALNFSYDRFDESGAAIAGDPFNFDGEVYPLGAALETDLRADANVIDVSYAIWQKPHYEAGIGLGLHAFDFEAGIEAYATAGGDEEYFKNNTDNLIAPVPNVRLFGTYAFSPRSSLTANIGWLSLTYEDYEGRFWYFAPSLDYRFTEKLGGGFGFRYTDVDVEHDSGSGDFEEYKMDFRGITGYLSYSF